MYGEVESTQKVREASNTEDYCVVVFSLGVAKVRSKTAKVRQACEISTQWRCPNQSNLVKWGYGIYKRIFAKTGKNRR